LFINFEILKCYKDNKSNLKHQQVNEKTVIAVKNNKI